MSRQYGIGACDCNNAHHHHCNLIGQLHSKGYSRSPVIATVYPVKQQSDCVNNFIQGLKTVGHKQFSSSESTSENLPQCNERSYHWLVQYICYGTFNFLQSKCTCGAFDPPTQVTKVFMGCSIKKL